MQAEISSKLGRNPGRPPESWAQLGMPDPASLPWAAAVGPHRGGLTCVPICQSRGPPVAELVVTVR